MQPGRALVAVLCVASLSACASTRSVSRPVSVPGAGGPSPATSDRAPAKTTAEAAVESALALVGTSYRFGGTTPQSGFDCSGFVAYVMGLQAVSLPRSVADQYAVGAHVSRNELRPGDLVFFTTTGPGPTHVGIVTDAEQAEFIHAPADGSRVRVDRLDADYWSRRWIGARRVL